MKALLGLTIAIAVLFGSCKTTTTEKSDLSALERFQSDDKPLVCAGSPSAAFTNWFNNQWAASQKGQGPYLAAESYKSYFAKALSAVPLGIQQFHALKGGRVILRGKNISCTEAGTEKINNEKDQEIGCIKVSPDRPGSVVPDIYLTITDTSSVAAVEGQISAIVTAFGKISMGWITELSPQYTVSQNGSATFQRDSNPELRVPKTIWAYLAIDDLIDAMKINKDINMPKAWKTAPDPKMVDVNLDRNARWDAFRKSINDPKTVDYVNSMAAIVPESIWCNGQTRDLLLSDGALFHGVGKWYKTYETQLDATFAGIESAEIDKLAQTDPNISNENILDTPVTAPGMGGGEQIALTYGVFPRLRYVLLTPIRWAGNAFVGGVQFFARYRPVRSILGFGFRAARTVLGGVARAIFPGNRCFRIRRRFC